MKLKRIIAAAIAVAVVGISPAAPIAHVFMDRAITASAENGKVVASGSCGTVEHESEVTWKLTQNNADKSSPRYTLTVSGTGAMMDYSEGTQPWSEYTDKISELSIGDNITTIGDCAFRGFTVLSSVSIPGNVKTIGKEAFLGCEKLKKAYLSSGLTTIGSGAFAHCYYLEEISIPDGVTSIGQGAFQYDSKLTGITIPGSMTSIGGDAFLYCNGITEITILNGVKVIDDKAFRHLPKLKKVSVPASVTSIGEFAFSDCKLLSGITIPYGVTSIGDEAFSHCTSLEHINIPRSVTYIGIGAFAYSGLTEVTLPESVKSMGLSAFLCCSKLTAVSVMASDFIFSKTDGQICNKADNMEEGDTVYIFNGTIRGYEGSTAQDYAKKYGYKFEAMKEPSKLGDIDGNGIINAVDASKILVKCAELSAPDAEEVTAEVIAKYDINWDGLITAVDASFVLAYCADLADDPDLKIEDFIAERKK